MEKTQYIRVDADASCRITISFGGGMGGCHRKFSLCEDVKQEGEKISFSGYLSVSTSEHDHNYINTDNGVLLNFNTGFWPECRIVTLLNCMDTGDMVGAMAEYTATNKTNKPKIITRTRVTAVGNWHMMERK